MNNPFKVLGLTPDFVRLLDDEGLREAAKRSYKQLSRRTHPDRGGRESTFREIAEAYSALFSSPEAFESYREDYLRPRKDRFEEMAAENDELNSKLSSVKEQFREFVIATACRGGVNLPSHLLMYDSLDVAISCGVSNFHGDRAKERATFDLAFEDGCLVKTGLKYAGQVTSDLPVGYHCEKARRIWVKKLGKSATAYSIAGKAIPLGFVPVGTISAKEYTTNSWSLKAALAITGIKDDFSRARSGYSWEAFQHLLPSLTTRIEADCYLIGAKVDEKGVRFILIGKIQAVAR